MRIPKPQSLRDVIERIIAEGVAGPQPDVLELEPDHDWANFGEMVAIFECAPSVEVWAIVVAWSPCPLPGVRWHCASCGEHENTMSFMNRPTHCGGPMRPEACRWIDQAMDEQAASLSVALLVDED